MHCSQAEPIFVKDPFCHLQFDQNLTLYSLRNFSILPSIVQFLALIPFVRFLLDFVQLDYFVSTHLLLRTTESR